ncbi:MAG: vWA domain-containing protein, partial [Jiangellaceae bacterium]
MTMPAQSDLGPRDVVDTLVGFARTLRAAGLAVAPTRVHAMIEAVDQLGAGSSDSVYWAGRLTLCASREDVGRYDQVFAAYFSGRRPKPMTRSRRQAPVREVAAPAGVDVGMLGSNDARPPERTATASRLEVLRHRDVSELSARDRAEVHRWVSALRPGGPERITRRRRAARRGVVDPHRTVRAMLRHGGEPARLRRHDHSAKPRRLVLVIDVSGSMALYADTLLRFAHAACRARPGTEVFTVGTRLTRVTRELSQRDPVAAMTAVSESILDWSGGTRLGEELKEFL